MQDEGLETLVITDEDDGTKWASNFLIRSMSMVVASEASLPVSSAQESGLETVDIEDADSSKTWATKFRVRSGHLVLVSTETV